MASSVTASKLFTHLKSAYSSVSGFRSARNSMDNYVGMSTRQMEEIVLNGHNIEHLAFKIDCGL